jgi:tetratricopeptide (TPR) repeat protein
VTNIIGRADLLAGLAVLSGWLMYLKAGECAGRQRLAWLAGLLAVTTLGVFSKESAVVIVGVIALYELTWWRERTRGRNLLLGVPATLLPIGGMLGLRSLVLAASQVAEFPFTDNPIAGAGFWTGRLTALSVIPRYLGLTLWPARLSSDYSYAQIPLAHGSAQDWAAWTVVLAAAGLVVGLYRWNRTAFFLACFAAMCFAPTSNLLFPIGTIMAERFLYLPSIGLLGCLVMATYAASQRVPIKRLAPVVLCVIIAAFTVRTWVRNGDWQDELSMEEASVKTSPNSFKVHEGLAYARYDHDPTGASLDRALAEAEKGVAIISSLPDSRSNSKVYRVAAKLAIIKGDALGEQEPSQSSQAYQRAVKFLERAIAIDKSGQAEYDRRGGAAWARRHSSVPAAQGDPEALWLLAVADWRLGKAQQATAAAREALRFHPQDPEAYRQISTIFAGQDRIEDAATVLMEGALITSDLRFKSDLLDLYRHAPGNSCAITAGPDGPTLNRACDAVHKSWCAAALEAVKAALEEERWNVARWQRQNFVDQSGCPAGPFDQLLPE